MNLPEHDHDRLVELYGKNPVHELLYFQWLDTYMSHIRGKTNALKDILYFKTQRGPLDEQDILDQIALPKMTCTQTQWDEFMNAIHSEYNKESAMSMPRSYFMSMKSHCVVDFRNTARNQHGIEHFYAGRDGEPLFDLLDRKIYSFYD
jgi:hypothetical protein